MGGFVSQIFLGVRLDCAKCHHHPSEKWGQEDYYSLAAFFAQMKRKGQAISAPISGEVEHWWAGGSGTVTHPVTDAVMTPKPPDGPEMPYVEGQDPRAAVARLDGRQSTTRSLPKPSSIASGRTSSAVASSIRWMTFALSNPPSESRALLDWLAQDFSGPAATIEAPHATMVLSRTYQLSTEPNAHEHRRHQEFLPLSEASPHRGSAARCRGDLSPASGQLQRHGPGFARGADLESQADSDFLDAFGRPNASQECPCERERKSSVVQALHLMNSNSCKPSSPAKKADPSWRPRAELPEPKLVTRFTSLPTTACQTRKNCRPRCVSSHPGATRQTAAEDLAWALINSAEFVFNH
jgi:hypothetical protein